MNMAASFAPSFADARPLAQHCSELTERGPRPEEREQNISAWRRDLSYELAAELAQLFSGGKLRVSVAAPQILSGKELFDKIGPVAVNNLLRCGLDDQTMLLSLDLSTAIALTDCSFGGSGEMPAEQPEVLPRSAGLLVEKCAGIFAQVIAISNGSSEQASGDVLVRSESVNRLKPFDPSASVALLEVSLALGEEADWKFLLAVAEDRLDAVMPGGTVTPRPQKGTDGPADAAAGPFAEMPLAIEAVLSEFNMTLGKLEQLGPGDEIPLPMPGDLPLKIGEEVLAHGMLGTLENRLALKITSLPGQVNAGPHPAVFTEAFSKSREAESLATTSAPPPVHTGEFHVPDLQGQAA